MTNRLRIARIDSTPYQPVADAAPDAALHRKLDALIRRHLPPVTASVLAHPAPVANSRFVAWYSDLAGQPEPLNALAKDVQAEVRALLTDRLESIAELAARLGQGDPANAALAPKLREAVSFPGEETIYVVGGQPVITFWGHRPIAAAAVPPELIPPPAHEAVGAHEPAARGRRLPRWAAMLLTLLLLAPLAGGLIRYCDVPWPPWGPNYAKLLQAAKEEDDALSRRVADLEAVVTEVLARCADERALVAARAEEERLQKYLGDVEIRLQEALALCPLRQQAHAAADLGRELEGRLDTLIGELQRSVDACRRKEEDVKKRADEAARRQPVEGRTAETGAPTKAPPAKSEAAKLPPCPGERRPEQAPDIAMVLDASGSMGLPASASAAEIQKQLRSLGGIFALGSLVFGEMGGPTRLDEAKKGVTNVVRSLPDDVDVGLVTLQNCPQATSHGFYSGAQRAALFAKVAGLRPMRGTPLAQAIVAAGQMIDGVNAPAVLVVISDGEDSCGGDPCAAARRMKQSKPQLKINVVDLIGDGAATCLATITGGQVLKPEDGLSFERMIKKASEEALKPAHCP